MLFDHELLFGCVCFCFTIYDSYVKDYMIFCICLCVYNNEEGLPYVLKNVEKICSVYPCVVLVFYDESSDRSLEILTEWSERLPMRIVINPRRMYKQKVENICYARNRLLDILRSDYSDVPYFIMMDSNNYSCVGDINIDVLDGVMGRSDWDAISFDREAGYYDFWALSYYPFLYSFFHFKDYKVVLGMMQEDFSSILENQKQKNNSCSSNCDDLIVVCSAFNGFSIYRTGVFLNCSYDTTIDFRWFSQRFLDAQQRITGQSIIKFKRCDCEHRKFHLEAIRKNNARIRISVKSLFKAVGSDVSLNFIGPA